MASHDYHGSEQSHYAQDEISSLPNAHGHHHNDSVRSLDGAAAQASSLGSAYSNPSGASLDNTQYGLDSHKTGSGLDNEGYSTEPTSAVSHNDAYPSFPISADEYAADDIGRLGPGGSIMGSGNGYGIGDDESRIMATHDGVEVQPELDNYVEDVVQPGFDEAILRALCDMDVRKIPSVHNRPSTHKLHHD